jgi:hypothetical protein
MCPSSSVQRARRPVVLSVFALSAVGAWCLPARADLPPQAYQRMQEEAEEELTIEVQRVTTSETKNAQGTVVEVDVKARVKEVRRTEAKPKEGAVIRIRYTHFIPKVETLGAGEVPILKAEKVYPAFLDKDGKFDWYVPAARGWSFYREEPRKPAAREDR